MQNQELRLIVFFIFSVTFLLLMVSVSALFLYAYKKKQALHLEKENKLKSEYENQLIAIRMEIHETTLTEISREIHDNINLSLTLAKLQLNTITYTDAEQTKLTVASSAELIGKTIDDLSDLSRSLNADIITSQGLINALEVEIDRIKRYARMNITLHTIGNTEFLAASKELLLFRVIQEALQNTIKHAHAKDVQIYLYYKTNELTIKITDDGVGYTNQKLKTQGTGITNMQERIKTLKGSFAISAGENKGTTIFIKIPTA